MHLAAAAAIALCGLVLASRPAWATEDLAAAVHARNPELVALSARAAEARAKVGIAGSWPDPRVALEVMDAPTLAGPQVAVSQMVPIAGQPGLMAAMAALEAEMREAERDDRALMLLAEGVRRLAELAYLARVEALTAASRGLAGQMARVAEAKYAVGRGMQADVLRAHLARTRLLEPPVGFAARRLAATSALAAIAPGWTPPPPVAAAGPALPPLEALLARAREASPGLRMKRLAVAHAEAEIALALAERLPDLALGVMAGRSMPGDMPYLGAMAMTSVPIWLSTKQARRVEAAERRLEAERAALAAGERHVDARLAASHAEAQAAERRLAIYRGGLIAQAREGFKAALAGYQVGRGDFLMVLDAQRAFYDAEMAEAMAVAERRREAAMALALAGDDPTRARSAP